nr:hypothetical protein [uncultured Carboxylicivirga sp.]
MKGAIFLLFLFYSFLTFGQNDSISIPNPSDLSHFFWDTTIVKVLSNSQIKIDFDKEFELYSYKIFEGDKNVFEYKRINKDKIANTKLEEIIVFEIDSNLKKFEFQNSELTKIKCILMICSDDCWTYSDYFVSNGKIYGHKLKSGKWLVEIEINNGKKESSSFFETKIEMEF